MSFSLVVWDDLYMDEPYKVLARTGAHEAIAHFRDEALDDQENEVGYLEEMVSN